MKRLLTILSLVTFCQVTNAAYYASPSGTGNGTLTAPFGLQMALASTVIKAGDTLIPFKIEWLNLDSLYDPITQELKKGSHKIIAKKIVNRRSTFDTIPVQIMGDSSEYSVNYMPKCKCSKDTTYASGKTITISGTATDIDGTISKYYWKKVSGSNYGKISYSSRATTTFTGARASVYKFRFEATDNNGGKCEDFVTITVK